MRMVVAMRTLATPALILFAAACAGDERAGDASSSPPAGAGQDTGAAGADTTAAVCLRGGPFVAEGAIPVTGGGGAADGIRALRRERHEGCERFVIDLGMAGDVAAAAGDVRVELLRDVGVVRATLAGVRAVATDATDASYDGPLARAAYAVHAPDGTSTWVDLHLQSAAEAAATVLRDPARVVIDLRPGGAPLPEPAASAQRVVVLRPRPGPATWPLRVTGYSRTFEANVVARIERQGRDVLETFTTTTAWVDAWGHFEMTLDGGPTGPVRLHVGEYSARDGTWEGVVIELVMR
jgi:hypothetical protein